MQIESVRGLLFTLLYDVKRLYYVANVTNKTPTSIQYANGSRKTENRALTSSRKAGTSSLPCLGANWTHAAAMITENRHNSNRLLVFAAKVDSCNSECRQLVNCSIHELDKQRRRLEVNME